MKGSLYANPTFIRKNFRQPTVISTRPLVAYDQSRLYFNNLSVKWQAKDIVNCTYSHQYKVLLVLSDDCKIHVLTEQLETITQLSNWQSKYVVGFQLIEKFNQMLLVGTTQIEVIKIAVVSNIKRTKFLSSMKFNIRKEIHLSVEPQHKLKWNKGYGYVVEEDLLYVWSLQDIFFYSLQKLTIRTKAVNITKKQQSITTAYFSNHHKYTIGGLMNGQIKIWRLAVNPLFNHKEVLIHSFAHHCKEVEQIIEGENQNIIISLGVDLYVCFLSIQTFQLLRLFNFVGQYTKIYLYDHLMAFAIKDGFLGELNYGKKLEFISELTGMPIHFDQRRDQSSKIVMTLSSNLGIQVNTNQLQETKQLNKVQLIHLYPPLKSKNIMQIVGCPFEEDAYYMLVEDGDIFHVRLENRAGRIDDHFVISKMNDFENHQLHQNATFIAFLKLVPPKFDTEMIQKVADRHFNQRKGHSISVNLLSIGCSRGSIIFVQTNDIENIYARITFHRQRIVNFQQVYNKDSDQHWLCSQCQEHYLKIVIFNGGKASCIYSIFFGQISLKIYGLELYLALVFDKGIFQIAKFTQSYSQPFIIVNKQSINHQEDIVSIHYRQDLQLILTGAKDSKIKIWTTCKVLVYEIILDEILEHCLWAGSMNIILIQNHSLCCLRNIPLKTSIKQIQELNQRFKNSYFLQDQFTLSKYVDEALTRYKERSFKIRSIRIHSFESSPTSFAKKQVHSISNRKRQYKSFNKSEILSERKTLKTKRKVFKTEQAEESINRIRKENDHEAVRKHLEQMAKLKQEANKCNFPKIITKNEDIFVQFMREKLLNKKLLTRRDITLNRIILKNLIKDHIRGDVQGEPIQSVRIE